MFGFLLRKKKDDVRRAMYRRMNRSFARQIGERDRRDSRGAFCEVVWIIPCDDQSKRRDFSGAYPAVTRDISPEGLSLIHTSPIIAEQVLVGLQGKIEPRFLLCEIEHCTKLGYGFYQIGLHPKELINLEPEEFETLERGLKRFPAETASAFD